MLFNLTLTFNFSVINLLVLYFERERVYILNYELRIVLILNLFLIVGMITKSAQIVFNLWLPDAMEGPTPVSSLIHSATMVAAGLMLMLKLTNFMHQLPVTLLLVAVVGFLTNLSSSLEGLVIMDYKSALAGSTCDQLGLMFLIYGYGQSDLVFFHFLNHAFYKSLLFLTLGALIHQTGEQEGRFFIISTRQTPLIFITYQIGFISLIGFPGAISHYSKASIVVTLVSEIDGGITTFFWGFLQLTQFINIFNSLIGAVGCFFLYNLFNRRRTQLKSKNVQQSAYIKMPLLFLSLLVLFFGTIFLACNKGLFFSEHNYGL